jgi:hypothetical protein
MVSIGQGTCHVLYAYDIGMAIDLARTPARVASLGPTSLSGRNRRAPRYFDFSPPPLTIVREITTPPVGRHDVSPTVSLTFYDFGALSIGYEIPFSGGLDNLRELSVALDLNEALLDDSRRQAAELIRVLGDAIENPGLAIPVESYAIFEAREFTLPCPTDELPRRAGRVLAGILRAETEELSEEEVTDALACRIAYGRDDLTFIDWNAALVFDRDAEDVRAVLEFANVELLELRFLDARLDTSLDRSFELAVRRKGLRRWLPGRLRRDLREVSRMQLEGAILFERVSNAPKLLGDQFLARVYRLAAQRFHLGEWNASILRKLDTVEDFYRQINDNAASRRLELLEWIIIILIALEIVMPFIPGLAAPK